MRTHAQLRATLETITPAELAAIAPSFTTGAILRVDGGYTA